MSLGFEQILKNEKTLLTDRGVLFGVLGAISGAYIGQSTKSGFPVTAALIAAGHFAGHSVHEATK